MALRGSPGTLRNPGGSTDQPLGLVLPSFPGDVVAVFGCPSEGPGQRLSDRLSEWMLLRASSWEKPRSALDSGPILPSTWSCCLQLPSQLAFLPGVWGPSPSLAKSSLGTLCPSPPSASLGASDSVVCRGFSRAVLCPPHTSPAPPPLPTGLVCVRSLIRSALSSYQPHKVLRHRGSATHPRTPNLCRTASVPTGSDSKACIPGM